MPSSKAGAGALACHEPSAFGSATSKAAALALWAALACAGPALGAVPGAVDGTNIRADASTALAAAADPARAGTAAAPDLDAVVSVETRRLLPSGVTRVERWRERLVRRGTTVWTERVVPAGAAARAEPAGDGHRHFDADAAARLLRVDARGQTQLRFVDAARRLVVAVPPSEWDAVGFDGRHDAAAHLVPPALVERMPLERVAAGGDRWHRQQAGGWTHRVLWSSKRQVALRIESTSDDGRTRRSVRVEPAAATAASQLPWRAIDGYTQRDYDDFMD